jgi:hypothetical protein
MKSEYSTTTTGAFAGPLSGVPLSAALTGVAASNSRWAFSEK